MLENGKDIAEAVIDKKQPFWKKCKTCGEEWNKFTPSGQCSLCDPDHLNPPRKIQSAKKTGRRDTGDEDVIVAEEPKNYKGCSKCNNSGHVSMIDKKGNSYAFACSCAYGDDFFNNISYHDKHPARWNGKEEQFHRFKWFHLWNANKGKENPAYFNN